MIIKDDVVQHFKREFCSEEEKKQNKHVYVVDGFAKHTETGEDLVIYTALYPPYQTFARPVDLFYSKVDKEKYPNVKQEYRLEKIGTREQYNNHKV